jgi:TonB family protein
LCGAAAWLLRRKTAELRFQLWKWLLLSLFALPMLISMTPRLSPRFAQPSHVLTHVETSILTRVPVAGVTPAIRPSVPEPADPPSYRWFFVVPVVYASVTLILLLRLSYSLITLRIIADRCAVIRDCGFRELAHEIWLKSEAFIRPRFVSSSDIRSPVTFDADDTWILLPENWRTWNEDKLRAVLAHEMAHVKRGDAQTLFVASLATCLFWFNPVAWFLQQQLAALAEEACDEFVINCESSPERYANLLIEFVRDLQDREGRLVGAIAVAGSCSLKRRIERLFVDTSRLQQGKRALAVVALALFVPALYLTAAARSGEEQEQSKAVGLDTAFLSLSSADVAKLEADVQANPEHLDSRMELIEYYGMKGQQQQFAKHLLWFIQNHPGTETLSIAQAMRSREPLGEEFSNQITAAWEKAVAENPHSVAVLKNAANFVEKTNPERAMDLFRQAEFLAPGKHFHDEGVIYALAEAKLIRPDAKFNNIDMSSETAARLRGQLDALHDPAALCSAGKMLVELSSGKPGDPQFALGLQLIQRAIDLDPGNVDWIDTMQAARGEPQLRAAYESMRAGPPLPQGTVRIGAKIAEASLISKTDPVYPAAALSARISGTVKFTVTVGVDGKVEDLQLVSGHPLMVQAATDAVLTYVYHPATVDGKAVPFVTEVMVPFSLRETQTPSVSDTPLLYPH